MRAFIVGFLGSLLGACSPTGFLNSIADTSTIEISRDIPYDSGPRCTLDVYAPRAANNAPVAIFYYGGGWESGAKESYAFVATALASEGIVVIVPDYRIYPEVRFPEFLNDAAGAARWVRDHASSYGADPKRLVLVGHSAGAHIASMLTLDRQWLASVDLDPRRDIAGTVGLAGPYDFLPLKSERLKAIFGPPEQRALSQPINFIDGAAPPMLLIAGGIDFTVDPANTTRLAQRIEAAGGEVRTLTYPWIGHSLLLGAVAKPFRIFAPTLADTTAFIKNSRPASDRIAFGTPTW